MALTTSNIAVWEMDDASGNATDSYASNHLSEAGTGSISSTTGKISNARTLVRSSQQRFAISSGLVTSLPMSLSMWFKLNSTGLNQNLFASGINLSEANAWGMYVSPGNKLGWFAANGGGSFIAPVGTTTLSSGTWYHLVLVWTNSTDTKVYLDNSLEITDTTGRSPSGSADRVQVGAYHYGGTDTADAAIDQTALWSQALSTGDISTLNNSGSGLAYASWAGGGGATTRGRAFGQRGNAFNGGRTFMGIICD